MELQCPICFQLNIVPEMAKGHSAYCCKCDSPILKYKTGIIIKTVIYTVSAAILYVPANLLPILSMEKFGMYSENTILSGCAELLKNGFWGIAIIVFIASILVPLLKLMGMFYIVITHKSKSHRVYKTRVYRVIHAIGPWSMLDIFLVAILVSLVKLGDIAKISPEPGLVAFAGVVVLTLLASSSFDPKIIWSD